LPGRVADLVAVISRQLVLPLVLAASLLSANAFGGTEAVVQNGDPSTIADFFDGLRAWELKERPTAVAIWLRAAEWGDVRSMEKVGELFEQGEVLPHDTTLAYFWFSQAAQRGVASAKAAADRLRSELPKDHLSEIDAGVASWQPKSLATAAPPERKLDVADLLAALNARDIQKFRAVLSSGISASSLDPSGTPVIFLAIVTRDADFVRALLDQGADPNAKLPNGMTPLHIAADLGNTEFVEMLIAKGASAMVKDRNGVTPLEVAERKKFVFVTALLRRATSERTPQQLSTNRVEIFDRWTAYIRKENSLQLCYLTGEPQQQLFPSENRKPPMVMVTHRPAEKIINVVTVVEGYPLKKGSQVSLDVGDAKFDLFTKGDSAWAPTAELDSAIVQAMAKAKGATAKGIPQKGQPTTDLYSLTGFPEALGMIDKACAVTR
jgi:hypothetical protein